MRESLENVKVGDVVILHAGAYRKIVNKVRKVTATMIHVGNERYRKKDGNLVGAGPWDLRWITIPKEGEIEEMKRQEFIMGVVSEMKTRTARDVTYEQAVKIKEVLGL